MRNSGVRLAAVIRALTVTTLPAVARVVAVDPYPFAVGKGPGGVGLSLALLPVVQEWFRHSSRI
ncbi:hypothetical protein JOE65_002377 [Arthrobacter roseus]|nr:hypothetical protein [Arthrobacter roseus]